VGSSVRPAIKMSEIRLDDFCRRAAKIRPILSGQAGVEQIKEVMWGISNLYHENVKAKDSGAILTHHGFASSSVPLEQLLIEIGNCSGVRSKPSCASILQSVEQTLHDSFTTTGARVIQLMGFWLEPVDLNRASYRLYFRRPDHQDLSTSAFAD